MKHSSGCRMPEFYNIVVQAVQRYKKDRHDGGKTDHCAVSLATNLEACSFS